jgi:hypothetical protein
MASFFVPNFRIKSYLRYVMVFPCGKSFFFNCLEGSDWKGWFMEMFLTAGMYCIMVAIVTLLYIEGRKGI